MKPILLAGVLLAGSALLRADLGPMRRIAEPTATPIPGILEIGSVKQTFLDDRVIHEASQLSKFVTRPRKYSGNPVIVADRPWEKGVTYGATKDVVFRGAEITGQTVIYDEEEKIFKMWYLPWSFPDGRRPWCYATSKDGYHWEKPNLGLYDYQGSKDNNIMADWADPCFFNVMKDPGEKDPARRYKALGEVEGAIANHTGGVALAFSPDGIHWTQYEKNPVVHHGANIGDAPTIMGWDAKKKKYVAFYRPGHPLAPEIYGDGDHRHIRSYGYSESPDFVHWSPTQLILAPDQDDTSDTQYMQLTAGIDGEFYIGFNAIYETHEQTWDIRLMSSRDGIRWNWIDRKMPYIVRGEIGTYDAGYMTPSGPIFHDGQVWIYYGAFSGAHSDNPDIRGADVMSVALCTLPQNRWIGLMAGPQRATLVTRPMIFSGSKLIVDVDASLSMQEPRTPPRFDEAQMRVALEDQSGGPIPGFDIAHSNVISKSGPQEISWSGADLSKLAGRAVRLRFEYRNAVLYSFQFQ